MSLTIPTMPRLYRGLWMQPDLSEQANALFLTKSGFAAYKITAFTVTGFLFPADGLWWC